MAKLSELRLTKEKRELYASLLILDQMINHHKVFKIGEFDSSIDKIIEGIAVNGHIDLKGLEYIPTTKGRDLLNAFKQKHFQFVKAFDVYSSVDIASGDFAFSLILDIESDEQWDAYQAEERFSDLRLAVVNRKGMDPMECALMMFIDENKFDFKEIGWETSLMSDLVWDEMTALVNDSSDVEDLAYEGEDEFVAGETILDSVIVQGAEIMVGIFNREAEMDDQDAQDFQDALGGEECEDEEEYEEIVTTTVYVEEIEEEYYEPYYYESYYDPLFVPTVFALALIL